MATTLKPRNTTQMPISASGCTQRLWVQLLSPGQCSKSLMNCPLLENVVPHPPSFSQTLDFDIRLYSPLCVASTGQKGPWMAVDGKAETSSPKCWWTRRVFRSSAAICLVSLLHQHHSPQKNLQNAFILFISYLKPQNNLNYKHSEDSDFLALSRLAESFVPLQYAVFLNLEAKD